MSAEDGGPVFINPTSTPEQDCINKGIPLCPLCGNAPQFLHRGDNSIHSARCPGHIKWVPFEVWMNMAQVRPLDLREIKATMPEMDPPLDPDDVRNSAQCMTKREAFAFGFMKKLIENPTIPPTPKTFAHTAVSYADCLIEELRKPPTR